jgi:hypothetical protein
MRDAIYDCAATGCRASAGMCHFTGLIMKNKRLYITSAATAVRRRLGHRNPGDYQ